MMNGAAEFAIGFGIGFGGAAIATAAFGCIGILIWAMIWRSSWDDFKPPLPPV